MSDPSVDRPVDPLAQAHVLLRTAHGLQVGSRRLVLPQLTRLQAGRLAQELAAVIGWTRVYLRSPGGGQNGSAGQQYAHDRLEHARRKVELLAVAADIGTHPVVNPVAEAVLVLRQAWGTIRVHDTARLAKIVLAVADIAGTVAADGQQGRDTTWRPAADLLCLAGHALHAIAGTP